MTFNTFYNNSNHHCGIAAAMPRLSRAGTRLENKGDSSNFKFTLAHAHSLHPAHRSLRVSVDFPSPSRCR